MYVSITGLKPKSVLQAPRFWWHAIRSMRQAQVAPGNLSVEARTIAGTHHTMSLWQDRAAMRAYLGAGAHREAMRASRGIGTGAIHGYESEAAPDWADVPALLSAHGRVI
jgi:heme-degrading monooxygenase HmoA